MKLKNVRVGDKFFFLKDNQADRMYLRIDMDLKTMLPTLTRDSTSFANLVPALDLSSYKIVCLSGDYEAEVEYDNVYI